MTRIMMPFNKARMQVVGQNRNLIAYMLSLDKDFFWLCYEKTSEKTMCRKMVWKAMRLKKGSPTPGIEKPDWESHTGLLLHLCLDGKYERNGMFHVSDDDDEGFEGRSGVLTLFQKHAVVQTVEIV